MLNARAVHQDIQPPETGDDLRDQRRSLRAVRQVRLDVEQFRAGDGHLFLKSLRSAWLAATATFAPARASPTAIARPSPRRPPVTSATFPKCRTSPAVHSQSSVPPGECRAFLFDPRYCRIPDGFVPLPPLDSFRG